MLKQRVLTALPLAVAFVAAIFWLPLPALAALFAGVVALGAHEWARLAGMPGWPAWIYAGGVTGLGLAAWSSAALPEPVWLALGLAWWAAIQLWMMLSGVTPRPGLSPGWLASGLLTLVLCFVALMALASLDRGLVLFALLIVWAADIGAYFSGRTWGRHKLAPQTSPGKSWEGVAGGLAAVGLLALAAAAWIPGPGAAGLLVAALLAGGFSVTGDLLESRLKRRAGAKDSGQLLPGHGGVLDRIDSLTAAAPVFWCAIQLVP